MKSLHALSALKALAAVIKYGDGERTVEHIYADSDVAFPGQPTAIAHHADKPTINPAIKN